MLPIQQSLCPWTLAAPSQELLSFESSLKSQLLDKFSQQREKDLIERQWSEIRDQACRNAGLSYWGEHVLASQSPLESAINNVIEAIDPVGYEPWPQYNHPNHISDVFEHIFYPRATLPDFTWEELRALFVQHNPGFMDQARGQFEGVFPCLLDQIDDTHPDKVTEALADHLIGFYAFMEPQHGAEVKFLQKIDRSWKLVTYQITRILLTNTAIASPVYAYGCTPVDNESANRLLLYRGTTYRSQDGALLSYMADLTPMHSVGELIYNQGREAVGSFIEQSEKPVHVYGLSLGGALSILTGEDFPDKTVVHAHAAPGKLPWTTRRINGENVYHDADIVVPTLGFFDGNIRLYKTITVEGISRNFHKAHMLPPAGTAPTIILRVDTKYENERLFRKIWTVFHQAISLVLFTALTLHLLVKRGLEEIYRQLIDRCEEDQAPVT